MRGELYGSLLGFDLVLRLLASTETTSNCMKTVAAWSAFLDEVGFEQVHIDPDEFPAGMSAADCMAAH